MIAVSRQLSAFSQTEASKQGLPNATGHAGLDSLATSDRFDCFRLPPNQGFPREEIHGLISQLRRASVSVARNIAEGRGRLNPAEFRQFLGKAVGSTFEIKTQLIVAKRLEMGRSDAIDEAMALSKEVSKMLTSFIQTLSSKAKTAPLRAES